MIKKLTLLFTLTSAILFTTNTQAQVYPYADDFESYGGFGGSLSSGGWSTSTVGFSCYINRGLFASKAATKELFHLGAQRDSLTSKLIGPLTLNSQLFYSYRFVDGSSSCNCVNYTLAAGDKMIISIGVNGANYDVLKTIDATNDDGLLSFKTDSIKLDAYDGSNVNIRFAVYRAASTTNDFKIDIDNVLVQDDPLLSVKNIRNENKSFSVYPSPAKDFITLNFDKQNLSNSSVSIFNSLGESVFEQSLNNSISNYSINTSNLSRGIYLVKFRTSNIEYSKMIVLE